MTVSDLLQLFSEARVGGKINETDDLPLMVDKKDMFTIASVTLQVLPLLYGVLQTQKWQNSDNFMMRILAVLGIDCDGVCHRN